MVFDKLIQQLLPCSRSLAGWQIFMSFYSVGHHKGEALIKVLFPDRNPYSHSCFHGGIKIEHPAQLTGNMQFTVGEMIKTLFLRSIGIDTYLQCRCNGLADNDLPHLIAPFGHHNEPVGHY